MGRSGYLGGSTIVGGFGWSSFDPASSGKIVKKRGTKTNQLAPPKGGKNQPAAGKKKPSKAQRLPNMNMLRLTYLEQIIDAALRARPAPVPPKHVRDQLVAATMSAGGPVEWAKAQPEYAATLEKKQKKLARKAQAPAGDGYKAVVHQPVLPNRTASLSETHHANRTRSIEALCMERARLSVVLTAAEAEVQKHRTAIAEIDRLLTAAKTSRR